VAALGRRGAPLHFDPSGMFGPICSRLGGWREGSTGSASSVVSVFGSFIHAMHIEPSASDDFEEVQRRCIRRADLLSALCQETAGDFSAVTLDQLHAAERTFLNVEARLPGTEVGDSLGGIMAHALPSKEVAGGMVEATLAGLKAAGVLAILRAKGDAQVTAV
jgi:hypothetical protein